MADITPHSVDPSPAGPSPSRQGPLVWALVGMVIALVIVLAVVLLGGGDDESDASGSDDQTDEAGGDEAGGDGSGDGDESGGGDGSADDGGDDGSGATPEQIRAGQAALQAVGCYNGAIDGAYGPLTDQAIRDFQRASGLSVDGVLGPATIAALEAAVAARETVCEAPAGGSDDGGSGDGGSGGGGGEVVLTDAESPAGGTVKQLGIPGPGTSVLLACDQDGFEPFFFTDQGNWVGCQAVAGAEAGAESTLTDPVLAPVESPADGTVAQLTIPGPQSSALVTCQGSGFSPFLFTDQGTWVGCQGS